MQRRIWVLLLFFAGCDTNLADLRGMLATGPTAGRPAEVPDILTPEAEEACAPFSPDSIADTISVMRTGRDEGTSEDDALAALATACEEDCAQRPTCSEDDLANCNECISLLVQVVWQE